MLADRIAAACLSVYDALPPKGKPRVRSNGKPEWTVLAGVALVDTEADYVIEVISLGTGVKCLPGDRLPLHGDVLHDSHAEIVARRAFILWLYGEIARCRNDPSSTSSSTLKLEKVPGDTSRLRLKTNLKLYFYISTLPCGDASTLHLATRQAPDAAAVFSKHDATESSTRLARGRQGYQHLGALRTKPARADAITTRSLSCSDKLASYSYLGIQGALHSHWIDPIYVQGYIFGDIQETTRAHTLVECKRALYGRLLSLCPSQSYALHEPEILFTDVPFPYSQDRMQEAYKDQELASAAESLSWVSPSTSHVTSGGVKQGSAVRKVGPQASQARSSLCRASLLEQFCSLTSEAAGKSYAQVKQDYSSGYQRAKHQLRGNEDSPFREWVLSGDEYMQFTC